MRVYRGLEVTPSSAVSTSGTLPAAHHADPDAFGGAAELAADRDEVTTEVVEGVDHRGVRLHDRPLQLGTEIAGQPLENARAHRRDPARLEVDNVELLLDPEAELGGVRTHFDSRG